MCDNFVDDDNDGINDLRGTLGGGGNGPHGSGDCDGSGFVDEDGDGVCDNAGSGGGQKRHGRQRPGQRPRPHQLTGLRRSVHHCGMLPHHPGELSANQTRTQTKGSPMKTVQRTVQLSRRTTRIRGIAVALALALALTACSTAADSEPVSTSTTEAVQDSAAGDQTVVDVDTDGTTTVDQSRLDAELADLPAGTLTAAEIDGLLLMREEEKLAHDVYGYLYDLWQVRVFSNIAEAETTHTDAVQTLLDRYGLEDPAAGNAAGVFTNPDLQALYDELVDRGSESLVEALEVGALIEDLDIVDLRSLQIDTAADIATVYANLEKGSRNHLRAFISNLDRRGETYTPTYLTPDGVRGDRRAAPPNEETARRA